MTNVHKFALMDQRYYRPIQLVINAVIAGTGVTHLHYHVVKWADSA